MSLQFYVGPSGSGKSTRVYSDILAQAEQDINTRYFVVVPDQFTMRTQQVLCQLSSSGGIMNVEVLSFSRLAHRIFEECNCEKLTRLDDTGKNLILRAVANEHLDELSVLKRSLKRTGNIAQVKSMISEFAQYGIHPEDLSLMIEATSMQSNLSSKLKDLQVLYRAYQDYIRGNYITTEETIDLLIRLVPQSALLKDSVVVFDGYTGFTPIQENLIRELLLHTRQVIVTLLGDTLDDVQGEVREQDLYYLTAKAYHRLTYIAGSVSVPIDEPVLLTRDDKTRFANNAPLDHLERQLFRQTAKEEVSCEEKVQIYLGADPKAEVDFVCTKMKQLIRQKDYAYRDFAVITGDLGSYGKLLSESFAEHEIPLFLDQNASLLYHPFMVLLNGLIDVVNRDFSYDSVMNVLRTGYFGLEEEALDYFELYLLRYGVRGHKKYEQSFIRTDDNRALVNEVRERFMEVMKPLLDAPQDSKGYVRALYDICLLLDMEAQLKKQAETFTEASNFVKAKEYDQVYAAVMNLFDQIFDLLDEPMDLEQFGEILKAGFAELKVGSIPQNVDQVVAGDLERTRLKPIKVLFIVGVNDGIIPGKGGSGGILSDMERSLLQDVLRQRQWELAPTPREKGFEERIYLYMNMTQPMDELIMTFAGVSTSGEAQRPSYLIDVVTKLYNDLSVRKLADANLIDGIESVNTALRTLSGLLRDYVDGQIEPGSAQMDVLLQLMDACKEDPHFADVLTAAFFEYHPCELPREVVEQLFGKVIHSSVSRLEMFSKCAYAHFLQYGIKLQDTEVYEFDNADLGSMYHAVLCQYGETIRTGEYSWLSITKEQSDELIDTCVDVCSKEVKHAVLYDTCRNQAMKERVKAIAKTTVDQLTYQLRKGLFEPVYYEMLFAKKGNPSLGGKVDRVDIALDEENAKAYVKVIDYKSSAHKFDPVKLYLGLDLQLAVYLDAAMKRAQEDYKDKSVVPAAILYYQVQDPIVEASVQDSDEVRADKVRKECVVQGLILEEAEALECMDATMESKSDVMNVSRKRDGSLSKTSQTATRHQMDLIGEYASYKISQIAKDMQKGDIRVSPYKEKKKSACDYCSYRGICGFDTKIPGYYEKTMESIDQDRVYDLMEIRIKESELGGEQS